MVAVEHRHQHRSIEEALHRPVPRLAAARSSRSRSSISSVEEAERGCPLRNTQTPCSLARGPVPRTGRSVICSPAVSISSESPGSRWSSSRKGLGMTTRPALSMTKRVFILVSNRGSTHRLIPYFKQDAEDWKRVANRYSDCGRRRPAAAGPMRNKWLGGAIRTD